MAAVDCADGGRRIAVWGSSCCVLLDLSLLLQPLENVIRQISQLQISGMEQSKQIDVRQAAETEVQRDLNARVQRQITHSRIPHLKDTIPVRAQFLLRSGRLSMRPGTPPDEGTLLLDCAGGGSPLALA